MRNPFAYRQSALRSAALRKPSPYRRRAIFVTLRPLSAPCRAPLQLGGKRTIKRSGASKAVQVSVVFAEHSNNVARNMLTEAGKTALAADDLAAYVGHANGYVLAFTNGLRVYLSGDTGIMADMRTIIHDFYRVNLAVLNLGAATMPSQEAAFAINSMIQPAAVIPSHASEGATMNGHLKPDSRTKEFADLITRRAVHVPLSGKTMEFDGRARCVAGC